MTNLHCKYYIKLTFRAGCRSVLALSVSSLALRSGKWRVVVSHLFLEEGAVGTGEACNWRCRHEYSSSDTCSPLVQQSNSHCGVTTWGLGGW